MIHLVIGVGFILTYMLQMSIVSRLPLLSGTADIVLIFIAAWTLQERSKYFWVHTLVIGVIVSNVSAMPLYMPLIAYLFVFIISQLLKKRVWQSPIFAMFLIVFVGTLFQQFLYILSLQVSGITVTWSTGFSVITLPSLLLNILLVVPVFAIIQELSLRLLPNGQEV